MNYNTAANEIVGEKTAIKICDRAMEIDKIVRKNLSELDLTYDEFNKLLNKGELSVPFKK